VYKPQHHGGRALGQTHAQETCSGEVTRSTDAELLPGRRRAGAPARGGRGLHSSTSQLNVSAFNGIGGALSGCLVGVCKVSGGIGVI